LRSASRGVIALALGIALPTALLGVGWMFASLRERDLREQEARARVEGVALAVRGAVDESLEELVLREDERPFYLYNHYYVPEDVLSLSDTIAVSPLASDPADPRVVGHFQIDPDGTVRTPYATDPDDTATDRAARVIEALRDPELAWLADLVRGREPGALAPVVTPPDDAGAPALLARADPTHHALTRPEPAAVEALAAPEAAPDGPVTVSLNSYGNLLAEDLTQAQSGDQASYDRVQSRGRSAPIVERRTVAVADVQQQQAEHGWASSWSSSTPSAPAVDAALARDAGSLPRPRAHLAPRTVSPIVLAPSTPAPPLVPRAIEVDYTPMELGRGGTHLVLHRLVSHEGAAVVQGVVLDRDELVDRWLPDVARRHAAGGIAPTVVDAASASGCAVTRPASDRIDGVSLCFDAAALAADAAAFDTELRLQIAALIGLFAIVLFAIALVHRTALRAESLSKQKSAFVSAVSHELRTPLTTIRMHAEMLAEDLVDDERRPRVYDELASESVRLSRLVENVLEISRLEEGHRPLRASRGDLGTHVAEIARGLTRQVEGRGFRLVVTTSEEPVELAFDAQAVDQIVTNLVENSLKYAADAGDEPIEIVVDGKPPFARIRVLDRGPGIPEAERERVFERFHRVERPETAHKPGTGIGLALVRELARAHGGDATAHARGGGGTEICVTLALDVAASDAPT
jgi:signal transduction histidine kinase